MYIPIYRVRLRSDKAVIDQRTRPNNSNGSRRPEHGHISSHPLQDLVSQRQATQNNGVLTLHLVRCAALRTLEGVWCSCRGALR